MGMLGSKRGGGGGLPIRKFKQEKKHVKKNRPQSCTKGACISIYNFFEICKLPYFKICLDLTHLPLCSKCTMMSRKMEGSYSVTLRFGISDSPPPPQQPSHI